MSDYKSDIHTAHLLDTGEVDRFSNTPKSIEEVLEVLSNIKDILEATVSSACPVVGAMLLELEEHIDVVATRVTRLDLTL